VLCLLSSSRLPTTNIRHLTPRSREKNISLRTPRPGESQRDARFSSIKPKWMAHVASRGEETLGKGRRGSFSNQPRRLRSMTAAQKPPAALKTPVGLGARPRNLISLAPPCDIPNFQRGAETVPKRTRANLVSHRADLHRINGSRERRRGSISRKPNS